MCITYDQANLDKHEVSREEVDEALANEPEYEDLESSARGNARVMFVGFTFQGRLLEIGIEYFPDSKEHVFHAMDATKAYRVLFNKRKS